MVRGDDIESLAQRLAIADVTSIEQLLAAATKPPVRRRPRRAEPVTLRVRAALAGAKPPVWRRRNSETPIRVRDRKASMVSNPFEHRGPAVSNALVDRLRDEEAV